MYKHILLPTDGSTLSRQAIASGIQLARAVGASVLGMHVAPLPHKDQLEAWMHHDPGHTERWQALLGKFADDYLKEITDAARAANVPCTCHKVAGDDPAGAIVHAAQAHRCDLIYIGSHGWTEDKGSLLGSVTLKVLHESDVPVLVYKAARQARAAS
jgi:nucleotide-binding universal stress UspA family protein